MISFIVPAHNEEALIGQSLSALKHAAQTTCQPFEIIVVDDASTDATAAIARDRGARVISVHHRQIAATRNAGARQARGQFFFFVDADTLATPEAVAAGIKALRKGAVGGGCVFNFDGALPLWGRILHPVGVSVGRIIRLIGGCFLFCRSDVFRAVGGFSEQVYAAEELFFIRALKHKGKFVVPPYFVITSGRKIRTYSFGEITIALLRLWRNGRTSLQKSERLELWYGQRRLDPLAPEHQLQTIK